MRLEFSFKGDRGIYLAKGCRKNYQGMRIALITDGIYPYVIGGMQRHSFYLAKYLSQKKVHVTLVHFNLGDLDINRLELFSDAEKEYIENIVIPFPRGDAFPGHYIRASYKYSCLIYEALKNRLDEFDFIYSKGFSAWKLIEEKKKNPNAFPPIGVKFHGYEMFQKASKLIILIHQMMLKGPVKWMSLNADYVFSYGAKITDLIRNLGVRSDRIIEIPAGIEPHWITAHIRSAEKTVRFVFVGRYERRKGVEELNQALKMLMKEHIDFQFHFIGPFREEEKIMSGNIIYHGVISDSGELKKRLDETDVLVCPSWSEGMPNVILEAMSRGCAIIATDVGAVSLMVSASNGILIEPGNIPRLLNALKQMADMDRTVLSEMKKNSVGKVKNEFVYDMIIDKFMTTIQSLIKEKV
jgi:glycosyltransferase involved in cell wall biosynthesis